MVDIARFVERLNHANKFSFPTSFPTSFYSSPIIFASTGRFFLKAEMRLALDFIGRNALSGWWR